MSSHLPFMLAELVLKWMCDHPDEVIAGDVLYDGYPTKALFILTTDGPWPVAIIIDPELRDHITLIPASEEGDHAA